MIALAVALGVGHRVVAFTKNVELETVIRERRILFPVDGYHHLTVDIERTGKQRLDSNLHLCDFRHVVAFASDAQEYVLAIVGRNVTGFK